MHIEITPGQNHDVTQAKILLEHAEAEVIVADTAHDSGNFIDAIEAKGMKAVIKTGPNRKPSRPPEESIYGLWFNIERFSIPSRDSAVSQAVTTIGLCDYLGRAWE